MKHVVVVYRQRDGYWEATCPDVPELVAGDHSLTAVQALAHAALMDFLSGEEVVLEDVVEESAGIS